MSLELFGIKTAASKNATIKNRGNLDTTSNPGSCRSDSTSSTLTYIDTRSDIIGLPLRNSRCDKDRSSLQGRPNAKKVYTVRSTKASRAREELNRKKELADPNRGQFGAFYKRPCKVPAAAGRVPSQSNIASKNTDSLIPVPQPEPLREIGFKAELDDNVNSIQNENMSGDNYDHCLAKDSSGDIYLLKIEDTYVSKTSDTRTDYKVSPKSKFKTTHARIPNNDFAHKRERFQDQGDTNKRKREVLGPRPKSGIPQSKQFDTGRSRMYKYRNVSNVNEKINTEKIIKIRDIQVRKIEEDYEVIDNNDIMIDDESILSMADDALESIDVKLLGDAEHFQQIQTGDAKEQEQDMCQVEYIPAPAKKTLTAKLDKLAAPKKQRTFNLSSADRKPGKQTKGDKVIKDTKKSGEKIEKTTTDNTNALNETIAALNEMLSAANLHNKQLEAQVQGLRDELETAKMKLQIAECTVEHLKSQQQGQLANLSKRVSEVDELMTNAIAERDLWKSRAVELGKELRNKTRSDESVQTSAREMERPKFQVQTLSPEKGKGMLTSANATEAIHIEERIRTGDGKADKKHKTVIKILKTVKKLHLTPEMYEKISCHEPVGPVSSHE